MNAQLEATAQPPLQLLLLAQLELTMQFQDREHWRTAFLAQQENTVQEQGTLPPLEIVLLDTTVQLDLLLPQLLLPLQDTSHNLALQVRPNATQEHTKI